MPRYGDQNTDGSRSIRDFYDAFRRAGASARTMLVSAAAAQWNVPASRVRGAESRSGAHAERPPARLRRAGAGGGEAGACRRARSCSSSRRPRGGSSARTRPPTTSRTSSPARRSSASTSSATAWSTRRSSIRRCSAARSAAWTTRRREGVKGVQQTVTLDTFKPPHLFQPLGGVAVIADNTWAALKGRRQLKVEWNDGPHGAFESEAFKKQLLATVAEAGQGLPQPRQRRRRVREGRQGARGDVLHAAGGARVDGAARGGGRVHATARSRSGRRRRIRRRCRTPWPRRSASTRRTSSATSRCSAAASAASRSPTTAPKRRVLSKQLGKPVKVIWTREDDIRFDYYHTTAAVYHKATVDGRGKPTAWLHRSVFPPIASTFAPGAREPLSFELDLGLVDLPYDVPNIRAENGPADAHVRIGWFRAVSNNFHAFAAHSFADEMAQAAGRDSLEFLLDMLGPGQGARSQGAGRRLLELRRAVRQVPDRHAAAAPRARDRRREVGLGQEEAGRRLGHGHRRAPQLQHLRRLGRRGRGRRARRRPRCRGSSRWSMPA